MSPYLLMPILVFLPNVVPTAEIEQIRTAWQARQREVRSAEVSWTEERVVPRGALNGPFDPETSPRKPSEDLTTTIPRVSLMIGSESGQIRFETEDLDSRLPGVAAKPSLSNFNGSLYTSYTQPRQKDFGTAVLSDSFADKSTMSLRAPLLIYRALDPALADFDLRHFKVLPQTSMIDGVTCVVLQEVPGSRFESFGARIYVDATREFIPLRYTEVVETPEGESVVAQVDIAYKGENPRVPSGWRSNLFSQAGALMEAATARVLEHTLNGSIASAAFEFEIPANTKVADRRTGAMYFIDSDRVRRSIATWGNDPRPASYGRTPWLLIVNLVAVILLAAIYFLRRSRRTRA